MVNKVGYLVVKQKEDKLLLHTTTNFVDAELITEINSNSRLRFYEVILGQIPNVFVNHNHISNANSAVDYQPSNMSM